MPAHYMDDLSKARFSGLANDWCLNNSGDNRLKIDIYLRVHVPANCARNTREIVLNICHFAHLNCGDLFFPIKCFVIVDACGATPIELFIQTL